CSRTFSSIARYRAVRLPVLFLLLHFLSLVLGSVLVLMLPLLVWLTPDLRIKKSLLTCNWTVRKRLPSCKVSRKTRWLAFSRRRHCDRRRSCNPRGEHRRPSRRHGGTVPGALTHRR